MAKLNDDQKAFIVRALACFDSPSEVAEAVKKEYGIVVTRQQCEVYDPTKKGGAKLAEKWRIVYEASRKKFVETVGEIPIASKSYRLKVLQKALWKAEERGNLALVLQILEQAAKEVGGLYTNKREIAGRTDGKNPLPAASGVMVVPMLNVSQWQVPAMETGQRSLSH